MRGWQARHVGDLDWKDPKSPPKYYTCPGMKVGQILYNLANAAKYKTGVIVEGVTDVWSFGPMAMCTMGASMKALTIAVSLSNCLRSAFNTGGSWHDVGC